MSRKQSQSQQAAREYEPDTVAAEDRYQDKNKGKKDKDEEKNDHDGDDRRNGDSASDVDISIGARANGGSRVNVGLWNFPEDMLPLLRNFFVAHSRAAEGCQLDLLDASGPSGASPQRRPREPVSGREHRALRHPTHRSHMALIERIIAEGMAAADAHDALIPILKHVAAGKLPKRLEYHGNSSSLFGEVRSIKACAGQFLVHWPNRHSHRHHHNHGDTSSRSHHHNGERGLLVLLLPGSRREEWLLHLFCIVAGSIPIHCVRSRANHGPCTHRIQRWIEEVGARLSLQLRLQFPSSPRSLDVNALHTTQIIVVPHILAMSPVAPLACIQLAQSGMRVIEADYIYNYLMPARVRDNYALVDYYYERQKDIYRQRPRHGDIHVL